MVYSKFFEAAAHARALAVENIESIQVIRDGDGWVVSEPRGQAAEVDWAAVYDYERDQIQEAFEKAQSDPATRLYSGLDPSPNDVPHYPDGLDYERYGDYTWFDEDQGMWVTES